jgi:two-component system NarL family sensor kinase
LQDDLIVALKKFVQKLYYSKVPIHFFSEGWQTPLNKNKEIISYRIIQESINNILKHAQATQINITAIQEKNSIDITIEDNGIGFNTETLKDGLGLLNIKKRMKYLNGEIDIQSSEGNGTCIMLHLSNVN